MKKQTKRKPRPLTNQDGEVRELTPAELRKFRPGNEVLDPKLWKTLCELSASRRVGQRGPQKKPKKILITLRYSVEVIDYFKSTGRGWQTKMDEALKEWVKKHKRVA